MVMLLEERHLQFFVHKKVDPSSLKLYTYFCLSKDIVSTTHLFAKHIYKKLTKTGINTAAECNVNVVVIPVSRAL